MALRTWLLLVVTVVVSACQCGTGARCQNSSTCPQGQVCLSGVCGVPAPGSDAGSTPDSGTSGGGAATGGGSAGGGSATGGGSPDAGCVTCGTQCCSGGQVCEAGECRLKCASGQSRCGEPATEVCCATSDVCFLAQCTTPGAVCGPTTVCPAGQGCDPAINRCLPLAPRGVCEYRPDAGTFTPRTQWFAQGAAPYTQVMMTPAVADLNGDRVPDVMANYFIEGAPYYNEPGVMRALSGDDGHLLWATATDAGMLVHPPASIAVADLEGNGQMTVVTIASAPHQLIAFDGRTGARRWVSRNDAGTAVPCAANWGGPAIADLDNDGSPEIICGFNVFDRDGVLKWSRGAAAGAAGPLTIAIDLDGNGTLEVTDGSKAYDSAGNLVAWTGPGAGGLLAAGDFVDMQGQLGRDGRPELVVVNGGSLKLVNGQTGALLAGPAALPSWNATAMRCEQGAGNPGTGGAPTVADFDGDGQPEVGVAAIRCYTMFKLQQGMGGLSWGVTWSNKTQDQSSSVTGSSVFDFQGDGRAEVLYADEVALHVYDGTTGTQIFTQSHCSGTTYEYPVIVDVNGNGRADIVMSENTYGRASLGCAADAGAGIHVLSDQADQWVNTRAIWNQHTYHVTNVCDGSDQVCGGPQAPANKYGTVPRFEPPNHSFSNSATDSGIVLNNYRQNVQGDGLFAAPDFVLKDFTVDYTGCPTSLLLRVRLVNQGSLGVLPGVRVAFYVNGSPRTLIAAVSTTRRLLPGESETLSVSFSLAGKTPPFTFSVVADDDGTGQGQLSECQESNNSLTTVGTECIMIQ